MDLNTNYGVRETDYPISFYLEDVVYSLIADEWLTVIFILIKRQAVRVIFFLMTISIHFYVLLLLNNEKTPINIEEVMPIEMQIINLSYSNVTAKEKKQDSSRSNIESVVNNEKSVIPEHKVIKNINRRVNHEVSTKKTIAQKTRLNQRKTETDSVQNKKTIAKEQQIVKVSVIEPRFDANYLNNPKPEYPDLSIRLHEEGIVMLNVFVSSSGFAERVFIEKSSGFERLDHSAQLVVKKWRFIAAKQGEESISSWVVVPISFKLEDE